MKHLTDFISQFHPAAQAFFATLFTWSLTAMGAVLVFFFKAVHQRVPDAMMGLAAALTGFLAGGTLLALVDKVLPT